MSKRLVMPGEKARKIAVAATAAGALLIFALIIIVVIQCVSIGTLNAKNREMDRKIAEYEENIGNLEKNRDFYESERGRYDVALEQGWKSK